MTEKFDYEIIYEYLKNKIKNDLQCNDKIPSENELCTLFNLTRTTVRQGINKLKNEGNIYSKKGSGNFVTPNKIEYTISPHTTFSKEILKIGKIPSIKVLEFKTIQADAKIAKLLDIQINDDVLYLKNVRYVNKISFLYAEYYMNISILKGIEKLIEKTKSISEVYITKYKLDPIRDSSEIEICQVTKESQENLNIQNHLPLIKISTKTIDQKTKKTIDYCYSYFRSDIAKIVVNYKDGILND